MVKIRTLSNGMKVVLEKMEHLRSVSFGVWVKVGSANEREENNGISHMIEHMLFKGTTNRTSKQIADDCARIGGNLNAYTSKECTSFYVTTLDTHLPLAIEILSDMVCNSLFDEKELEKEKEIIKEEIIMYDDSPDDMVHEYLQKEVWKGHPLGYIISGTTDIVDQITREEMLEFLSEYYTAENMVISIAGNYEEEETMLQLEHCFGKIASRGKCDDNTEPVYQAVFHPIYKEIEQVHMNIAFPCVDYNSRDKFAFSLLNSILGGSENSKLFQVVREELGLTYSIYSYGSSYNQAGLFHIDATMGPNKVEEVYVAVVEIIKKMKQLPLTEQELLCAKEQINTELIIGSESSRNRMNSNGKALLCRGSIVSLDETIQKVNEVSLEDLKKFVKKYFDFDKMSICLVGNTDSFDLEQLKRSWECRSTN